MSIVTRAAASGLPSITILIFQEKKPGMHGMAAMKGTDRERKMAQEVVKVNDLVT
jgi:hypothetical protein